MPKQPVGQPPMTPLGYAPRGGYLNKTVALAVAAKRQDQQEVDRLIRFFCKDKNFRDAYEQSWAVAKNTGIDPKRIYK